MPFLSSTVTTGSGVLQLGLGEICLRLLCAMAVGMIIGTEREYTNRPAGMRTHILVALGACTVMITSQLIFIQYSTLGSTPDPGRLSAQVITGVGFLGAGTILREGSHVKGLTTAASLWAVACLGIAAGGGYYSAALAGMVFIIITLTILEIFQHKFVSTRIPEQHYMLETSDITAALELINAQARAHRAGIRDIQAQQLPGGYRITFLAEIGGIRSEKRQQKFFEALIKDPAVSSVRLRAEAASVNEK